MADLNGSSSSSRLFGQVGNFSSVSFNHALGSIPFNLAVAGKLWIAAARRPARSEPENNQILRLCQRWHKRKAWLLRDTPKGATASA